MAVYRGIRLTMSMLIETLTTNLLASETVMRKWAPSKMYFSAELR